MKLRAFPRNMVGALGLFVSTLMAFLAFGVAYPTDVYNGPASSPRHEFLFYPSSTIIGLLFLVGSVGICWATSKVIFDGSWKARFSLVLAVLLIGWILCDLFLHFGRVSPA